VQLVASKEYRHAVRVAGVDLKGTMSLLYGLTGIKGIGFRLAKAIIQVTGLDPNMKIGFLTDKDVKKIEEVLSNPTEFGIPSWMLNRRKDYATGQDLHLTGSDLFLTIKSDIDRMKSIKSWRGIRHALGLKVRGQRTRTTGRGGRTIGVTKKKKK